MITSAARMAVTASTSPPAPAMAVAALLLAAASGAAGEPSPAAASQVAQVSGWRLIAGVMPAYAVEEDTASGTFEWEGTSEQAPLVALQYQRSLAGLPLSWGVELSGSGRELRPRSYRSGGNTYANLNDERLAYHSATLALTGTWHALQPQDERLALFVEAQASLGATLLTARLVNGWGSDRSLGYGGDAVLRLIAGLAERRWHAAALVGWHHGMAIADIELPAYRSDLLLERSGVEAAVVIGRSW